MTRRANQHRHRTELVHFLWKRSLAARSASSAGPSSGLPIMVLVPSIADLPSSTSLSRIESISSSHVESVAAHDVVADELGRIGAVQIFGQHAIAAAVPNRRSSSSAAGSGFSCFIRSRYCSISSCLYFHSSPSRYGNSFFAIAQRGHLFGSDSQNAGGFVLID